MSEKRGQVTIFIILGIVIVAVIAFLFLLRGNIFQESGSLEENERFVSSQLEPIKKHVINCVRESSLKGLILIAKQGGYFDPVKFEQLGNYQISYDCYKSDNVVINNLPLIDEMEDEFIQYMNDEQTKEELEGCIDDFRMFKDKGLNIQDGTLIIIPQILFNKVVVEINYPISVSKGDYSAELSEMLFDIPVALGKAHKVASDIINKECNNNVFDIDTYIRGNEPLSLIELQRYNGLNYWYLTTIQSSSEEIPIDFHFIIQK